MDAVRSLLPKVLRKRGLFGHAEASLVVLKAQMWVKKRLPLLADMIHVVKIQNGTLFLSADHSAALTACTEHLPALKEYLEGECKGVRLHEITLMRA